VLLGELLASKATVNASSGSARHLPIDEQQADLERDARRLSDHARSLELKQVFTTDRDRRRREQDKMSSLAAQRCPAAPAQRTLRRIEQESVCRELNRP